MCRLGIILALLLGFGSASAADFKLSNGDILKGEAASFNDDGLVVRLDLGGFSPRVPWGKFTQETLKSLQDAPEAKEFVEPYIEIPLEIKQQERQKQQEIRITEPPHVPHSDAKIGFFSSLANPLGFGLLGILYAANIYAGVQIARFRARPVALVAGLSAVVPILGPALFAALPSAHSVSEAADAPEASAAVAEGVNPMQQALPTSMAGSGLGLAAHGAGKAAGNPAYTTAHTKANTTFDRRFFETKFTGFFRVVPAEPEKDLVLVVKTAKKEVVAVRVSRISATELHVQLQRGAEEAVPFAEIAEVSVRPRAAK